MTVLLHPHQMHRHAKPAQQVGGVVIEFAIAMVLLLLIAAGTFGFGRAFWYADALTKATRDGARLLSTWPITTAADMAAGVSAATQIVVDVTNAANLSPQLTTSSVVVECAYNAFSFVTCAGSTKPANIRVRITGFSIQIGEWFAFIKTTGASDASSVNLSPHTTMRYMN